MVCSLCRGGLGGVHQACHLHTTSRPVAIRPVQTMAAAYKVLVAFHECMPLPVPWKAMEFDVKPEWTTRQLVRSIEARCRADFQMHVDVAMLLHHSRDVALPFHEPITAKCHSGDKVYVLGEVRRAPAADPLAAGSEAPKKSTKVPVTILTGFLGAGKTTLLNHLLRVQRDKRIAVIENEFGDVPIDNELLAGRLSAAEQVVVMDNGCMCCTVRGDLLAAFSAVMQTMVGMGKPLDAVVVETTGMADPVPIVRTFLQTPAIAGNFRMDGVVTLVDAKNVLQQLACYESTVPQANTVDEAFQQIAYADCIIISKLDLVPASEAVAVWQQVRALNAEARVMGVDRGRVDPQELTDLGAQEVTRIAASLDANPVAHSHGHGHGHGHDGHCTDDHAHDAHGPPDDDRAAGDHDLGHGQGHGHGAPPTGDHGHGHGQDEHRTENRGHETADSRHNDQVASFSVMQPGVEVDPLRFARWARVLANLDRKEHGALYRCKAVLAQAGSTRKLVFHAVADVVEQVEWEEWGPGAERSCKIVFIGKALDRPYFEDGFLSTTQAIRQQFSEPAGPGSSALTRLFRADPDAFYRMLVFAWTADVSRLGRTSKIMAHAVFHDAALPRLQRAAEDALSGVAWKGLQLQTQTAQGCRGGRVWLHTLVSMPVVNTYCKAVREAQVQFHVKELGFISRAQVTAAAVTWLELIDLADAEAQYHVVQFVWRAEDMRQFFRAEGTRAVLRTGAAYTGAGDWVQEAFKLRLHLKPCPSHTDPPIEQHRVGVTCSGGRACVLKYHMSIHSIHPDYQLHLPLQIESRSGTAESDAVFHKWHPLMAQVRAVPRLQLLVRVKPDGSGPLERMCGCC